jgi:hypothetical protein
MGEAHAASHVVPRGPVVDDVPQHNMPVMQSLDLRQLMVPPVGHVGSSQVVDGPASVRLAQHFCAPVQMEHVVPLAPPPLLLPVAPLLPVPPLLPVVPLELPPPLLLLLLLLPPPEVLGLLSEPHADARAVAIPTPTDAKKITCALFIRRTVLI